ncbi:MAG: isoprenyl transferase [Desulfobulbaceae bacterium]|jgi:undecaprenyl diphosphate synthase|nr:isoprenyl transferase [Desulfobulbaceae bacterium]
MQPETTNIPKHVAIIMDGNGRWAQARGLMRIMGHREGVKAVQNIVEGAQESGIEVLTLYAFSTENWNRPKDEVSGLMGLLKKFLQSGLDNMVENGIQLRCIGNMHALPEDVQDVLRTTIDTTKQNTKLILNLALSYGGRDEMVQAMQAISRKCMDGTLSPDDICAETVDEHLFTAGLRDPDLVIRTGGEERLSNFLLWQSSYSEIYFTKVPWPEFTKNELHKALADFQKRQRRFGKTGEQVHP